MGRIQVLLLTVALLALGCTQVTEFSGFETAADAGTMGDSGRDGSVDGAIDAGEQCSPACGSSGTCVSDVCVCGSGAACTGTDMCCAGVCVATVDDVLRCGACDNACPTAPRAATTCEASACVLTCEAGFGDCDGAPGCEADLGSPETCGGCDTTCAADEVCNSGVCESSCDSGLTNCDGSCVDPATSALHCGGCGLACAALANSNASCSASTCIFECSGAFEDCDGDLGDPTSSNGCEEIPSMFFLDGDSDGAAGSTTMNFCADAVPSNYYATSTDCDDADSMRYPGATEICDGDDEDCDLGIDEGTGVGTDCTCEVGGLAAANICDTMGGVTCDYPTEVCNGFDDDCDGDADDTFMCALGSTSPCTVTVGTCMAMGTSTCDSSCRPGACVALPETCNHMDDDCDGFIDEGAFTSMLASTVGTFENYIEAADIHWSDAAGVGATVWSFPSPGGPHPIQIRILDDRGRPLFSTVTIATRPGRVYGLGLAWDGSAFLVVWMDGRGGPLRFARVGPSGTIVTPEGPLSGPGTNSIGAVAIAADDNAAVIVYSGTSGTNLRARRIRDGSTLGSEFLLMTSVSTLNEIAVTRAETGRFIAAANSDSSDAVDVITFDATSVVTAATVLVDGSSHERPKALAYDPVASRYFLVFDDETTLPSTARQIWFTMSPVAEGPRQDLAPMGAREPDIAYAGNNTLLAGPVSSVTPLVRTRGEDGVTYPDALPRTTGAPFALTGVDTSFNFLAVESSDGGGRVLTQEIGCPP